MHWALHAPTYLESLSPRARERLLRGSGAIPAALRPPTARPLPARPSVSRPAASCDRPPRPRGTASLEEENQRPRQLHQRARSLGAAQRRQQAAADVGPSSAAAASVEQQAALVDLARSARALAEENAQLREQLEARAEEAADAGRAQVALAERLALLEARCAAARPAEDGSSQRMNCGNGTLAGQLLAHLPPAGAAATPAGSARAKAAAQGLPSDLRQALREIESLRRERSSLAGRVKELEMAAERARDAHREVQQARASERRAAAAGAAELQRALRQAGSRAERLVAKLRATEADLAKRNAYAAKLEARLLQHRRPARSSTAQLRPSEAGAEQAGTGAGTAGSPVLAFITPPRTQPSADCLDGQPGGGSPAGWTDCCAYSLVGCLEEEEPQQLQPATLDAAFQQAAWGAPQPSESPVLLASGQLNPLFSAAAALLPVQATAAEDCPLEARLQGFGELSSYRNYLYASSSPSKPSAPPQATGTETARPIIRQAPPQPTLLRVVRRQVAERRASEDRVATALEPAQVAELPSRMPSQEFGCLQDLLQVLGGLPACYCTLTVLLLILHKPASTTSPGRR